MTIRIMFDTKTALFGFWSLPVTHYRDIAIQSFHSIQELYAELYCVFRQKSSRKIKLTQYMGISKLEVTNLNQIKAKEIYKVEFYD